jgi:hypothetical protein
MNILCDNPGLLPTGRRAAAGKAMLQALVARDKGAYIDEIEVLF